MLDANLFRLLGLDDGWCVDKGSGGGGSVLYMVSIVVDRPSMMIPTYVLDLFDGEVGVGRYARLLGLDVNDD